MKDKITVSEAAFTRLTFRRKGDTKTNHRWVYDTRGYEFVHYPKTGKVIEEPMDSMRENSSVDTGILFDFYNDGWDKWFAFYTGDCFDPPMKLINARSFEEAYEIYCDEYADPVTEDELDELVEDIMKDLVETCHKAGELPDFDPTQLTVKEYLETRSEEERNKWRRSAEVQIGNDGQVSFASNSSPRLPTGLIWSDLINGFELELIKAEVLP